MCYEESGSADKHTAADHLHDAGPHAALCFVAANASKWWMHGVANLPALVMKQDGADDSGGANDDLKLQGMMKGHLHGM